MQRIGSNLPTGRIEVAALIAVSRKINRLRRIVAAAARFPGVFRSQPAHLPSMPLSAPASLTPASPFTTGHIRRLAARRRACSTSRGTSSTSRTTTLTLLSGVRPAGEPVHDMWVRVTIDRALHDARHRSAERPRALSGRLRSHRPGLSACSIGANLLQGFRKRLHDAIGHVRGCTHLTEMLGSLPTAAVQTFAGLRTREETATAKPFQLDRCHALETTSETVRRYYPRWYRVMRAANEHGPETT